MCSLPCKQNNAANYSELPAFLPSKAGFSYPYSELEALHQFLAILVALYLPDSWLLFRSDQRDTNGPTYNLQPQLGP